MVIKEAQLFYFIPYQFPSTTGSSKIKMHRIFTMDDLLYTIFSFLSFHELTVAARVYSTWSRCANSLLWRDANLDQAMEIYSGSVYSRHVEDRECKCIQCYPNTEGWASIDTWKRFQLYAPYIKEVEETYWLNELLREVSLMARAERTKHIFPKIRFLKWGIHDDGEKGFPDLSGLIAPNLDHLCFGGFRWMDRNPHPPLFNHICQLLEQRVPTLRTFQFILPSFSLTTEAAQCIGSVQKLLTFFAPTLRSVQLPGLFNTQPIIKSLLTLKNLCSLNMDGYNECLSRYDYNENPDIECDGLGHCHRPRPRRHISPCSFAFAGSSQEIERTFIGSFNFSSVTYFKWFKPSEYHVDINFIRLIPSTFPQLHTFYLEDSRNFYSTNFTIPWTYLKPILGCKYLTILRLPGIKLSMNRDELIDLLANRESWTVLEIVTDSGWLRLPDLYLFAKYCPNLVHLGITLGKFDSTWPDDLELLDFWFHALESVEFFDNVIKLDNLDAYVAGKLLYHICDRAVHVVGDSIEFHDNAQMTIAAYCIADQIKTRTPMSEDVREYAERAAKKHKLDVIIDYLNNTAESDVYDEDGYADLVPNAERDAKLIDILSWWM